MSAAYVASMTNQITSRDNKEVDKEQEKIKTTFKPSTKKVVVNNMREHKANPRERGVDKLGNQVEDMLNSPSY